MKKKTTKRRMLQRILAAAALLIIIAASLPSTDVAAADSTAGGSGGIDDQLDHVDVYIWHKGKPPAKIDGTRYPVFIYFDLLQDLPFHDKNDPMWGYIDTRSCELDTRASTKWRASYWRTDQKYFFRDGINYQTTQSYGAARNVVDMTEFDFYSLMKYDTAMSFSLPNVPFMVATIGAQNTESASYYAIGMNNPLTHAREGKDKWLYGFLSAYAWVHKDSYDDDDVQYNYADFVLDYCEYETVEDYTANKNLRFLVATENEKSNAARVFESDVSLAERTWLVKELPGDYGYSITTKGPSFSRPWRTSTSSDCSFSGAVYMNDICAMDANIELGHLANVLVSNGYSYTGSGHTKGGTSGGEKPWIVEGVIFPATLKVEAARPLDNQWKSFNLAYATAMSMSFLKSNFTVKSGSTTTLDGPVCINQDITITVEDGGVLSCTGWVVNNGRIVIKPGGTLILNNNETGIQGVISSYSPEGELTYGGAILCDGTIINMPGCELCCGGTVGLCVGSQAQVLNYGTIIANSGQFYGDHTIENRTAESALLIGYDVADGGYTLTAANPTISASNVEYPGMGIRGAQQTAFTYNSSNPAYYGKGTVVKNGHRYIKVNAPGKDQFDVTTLKIPYDGHVEPEPMEDGIQDPTKVKN